MNDFLSIFVIIVNLWLLCTCNDEFCYAETSCNPTIRRFLLYDVNPPEGFNLRRDVYMRMAVLAHNLQKSKDEKLNNFQLVLPPWSHLYHWKYSDTPEFIPWSRFFDLESLKQFAPVIEMANFFQYSTFKNKVVIDEIYILQHYPDMFESGNFEERFSIEQCTKKYNLNYFYYDNITSNNVQCLSFHGPATNLEQILANSSAKTILVHHAEVALHQMFGNKQYWKTRRSMRFNPELREIASNFRAKYFNSNDIDDNTELPESWLDEKPKRNARGGPYLAVHIRRGDFARGRHDQVPSIDFIIKQIDKKLQEHQLETVFLATDASDQEYQTIFKQLSEKSHQVHRFKADPVISNKYGDGGVAILDQIICSYARYFIGTQDSTFSFRIQEEREILGFPTQTTFNSFCTSENHCPQPSMWKIVH